MMAYINEHDPYPAAWLRGLYPAAHVDERSIADVSADDLVGYQQCHFFGGIGGWLYALELAGWPGSLPIWTGSCPCQPFSAAGKRRGGLDDRDLWPVWAALIAERQPSIIVGEQVASAIGYGWLDRVCADLEAHGYAVGATVLGAHSVGAPHMRQRLYWGAVRVANGERARLEELREQPAWAERQAAQRGGCAGLRMEPWDVSTPIMCGDGAWRRAQPSICLLVNGVSADLGGGRTRTRAEASRVGMLRGLGNAIVPQVGAVFLQALLGCFGVQKKSSRMRIFPLAYNF